MKTCADYATLLHGLVDGELDAANTFACEQHLADCTACTAQLHAIEQLRSRLHAAPLAYAASEQLRNRINASLHAQQHATSPSSRIKAALHALQQRAWPAATLAMAAALLLVVLLPTTGNDLTGQVIAGHVRSLQANHLVDVETSDRHVVKPWFAGKIDFSPPVIDLRPQGFELVGGRLDYLQNRTVAALAYRRRAHTINLFIWPATTDSAPSSNSNNGFNLIHWRTAGMNFWAISDLNAEELRQFQRLWSAQATP